MVAVTDGFCVSTLADYRPSTACHRVVRQEDISLVTAAFTFFGASTSAEMITLAGSGSITSTATTSFAATETSELVGAILVPMVTLVHRAEDVATPTGGGGDEISAAGRGRADATKTGAPWALLACTVASVMVGWGFLGAVV